MIRVLPAVIAVLLIAGSQAFSQSQDPPKLEVAPEFTTLNREGGAGTRTELGFGGRVTYNINQHFSVEGAGYFFPRRCFDCLHGGNMTEALGGVKVGKRFGKWGAFAKARPGFVSFSEGNFQIVPSSAGGPFPFDFRVQRVTSFATDLGGVLEFYPSRRLVTRFDFGDTLVHFGPQTRNALEFNPTTMTYTLVPFTLPARTTHNFQFVASVGFRF